MEADKRLLFLEKKQAQSLRRTAYRWVLQFPTAVGLSGIYASLKKAPPAVILMYHSVAREGTAQWISPGNTHTPEEFEAHLAFLTRKRNVVSLAEAVGIHESGKPFKPGTVVLTFDDGYLDNLEVVAPLLQKYDLPATFFLATDFMDRQSNGWWDDLYNCFRTRSNEELKLEIQHEHFTWDLTDQKQERKAYQKINWYCIDASLEERRQIIKEIRDQLAPVGEMPRLMMNWDEVCKLNRDYPDIEIGAHTAHHLNLVANLDDAKDEVMTSLARIEAAVGIKPRFLACPYNRHSPELEGLLQQLPLEAVVAEDEKSPVVHSGKASRWALPRTGVPYRLSLLQDWTSGAYPELARRLFGRHWTELQ